MPPSIVSKISILALDGDKLIGLGDVACTLGCHRIALDPKTASAPGSIRPARAHAEASREMQRAISMIHLNFQVAGHGVRRLSAVVVF
jgi:hypothetical protein